MRKKASESEFKDFCKRRGIYWHKFADILKCPTCCHTIWQSQRMPDFEITYKGTKTLVEVKQGSGTYGAWYFSDPESGIRANQREALDEWEEAQGIMPWLFLVLGVGRAPDGRGVFLIPWEAWKQIETKLLDTGQKTIRFSGGRKQSADDLLSEYRLTWLKCNEDHPGGWDIEMGHPFWAFISDAVLSARIRKDHAFLSQVSV